MFLNTTYSDQIRDAFIKPIRSVLAIDDRFPTLDAYLRSGDKPVDDVDADRLRKLISFCRTQDPQWLVDVHDGKDMDHHELPLLSVRQCDWLILDFKLDGDSGNGDKAIEIIRKLAVSDHFNLAVIYTAEDPLNVFHEVAVALTGVPSSVRLGDDEAKAVEDKLEEWEDAVTDIREKLAKEITHKVRFAVMKNGCSLRNPKNKGVLAGFLRLVEEGPTFKDIQEQEDLLKCLLQTRNEGSSRNGSLTFEVTTSAEEVDVKWMLAGNVFLAIVNKEVDATQLLEKLHDALVNWRPSPNRLILAKVRAELDAWGVKADSDVLVNRNLQAFWLRLLLNADERELPHHVGVLVDRQTELLTDRVRASVIDFTKAVIAEAKKEGAADEITEHFWGESVSKSHNRDEGMLAHNTHVSTKPPSGKNLVPGHILRMMDGGDPSYWVCLSPACDLEAGRSTGRDLKKRIKPWMPFTAVKLHAISKQQDALKLATTGWVLFPEIDKKRVYLSFFPEANSARNPIWEEFFAHNDGRLEQQELRIKVVRVKPPIKEGTVPSFEESEALIVAQLRAEYATCLTLRLTSHLSRVGLDYLGSERLE